MKLIIKSFNFLYEKVVKPILFLFDPEKVHVSMVAAGEFFGKNSFIKLIFKSIFLQKNTLLKQEILGMNFQTPIGLAAGFDYEARLTQILSSIGFGFQTVGTITNNSYEGNPRPMLGRLPKSKSLMVNKGFKNPGAKVIAKKLKKLKFETPLGISIGRTNSPKLTQKQSIKDIVEAFKIFEKNKIGNSYYELNISCPNLFGNVSFYPSKNLEELLVAIDKLKLTKPIFVKMPIDKPNDEVLEMLKIIAKHCPSGVIFGNLQKDRKHKSLDPQEVAKFSVGNFSGKPTFDRSNELISLCYKHYKNRFLIIGCGGVFTSSDAWEKIKRGASLIQLITGMVYQGPATIATINMELNEKLQSFGYRNIQDAVGKAKN